VQGDYLLIEAQRLAEQLHLALEMRAVIDQAIGITMSRSGATEAEALDQLQAIGRAEHQKLAVIARGIVVGVTAGCTSGTTTSG